MASRRHLPARTPARPRCHRGELTARKLHSCNPESARWCCSAPASARHRFSRCCTCCRLRTRHDRSCGSIQLATGEHHPFNAEVRRLLLTLTHGRSYVCYSRPDAHRQSGRGLQRGRPPVIDRCSMRLGLPPEADVYLCGPNRFMAEMKESLAALGIAPARIHRRDLHRRRVDDAGGRQWLDASATPCRQRREHRPARLVRTQWRSRHIGSHRRIRAFWSWPRRVTSRFVGRVEAVCATTARAAWLQARSVYGPQPLDPPAAGNVLVCCSQPSGDIVVDL